MAAPTIRRGRSPATALFWRLLLLNALVLAAAAAVLALSPLTVSAPVLLAKLGMRDRLDLLRHPRRSGRTPTRVRSSRCREEPDEAASGRIFISYRCGGHLGACTTGWWLASAPPGVFMDVALHRAEL